MIPKVIHYCWYGENILPERVNVFKKSWKKCYPDWEIVEWNEKNSPMDIPYMKNAKSNQNWANMSNFVRLYAIEKYGGIYFDTDVEVLKPFDFIDSKLCYLCLDSKPDEPNYLVNNAVIIADRGNLFIRKCIKSFLSQFDGSESADRSSPVFITDELNKLGFKGNPGIYKDVKVLANYYFYPASWNERYTEDLLTKETYTIHYCDATWVDVEKFSRDELIQLIKDLDNYKNKLRNLRSGNIEFKDLLKIIFRFLLNRLSFLDGKN